MNDESSSVDRREFLKAAGATGIGLVASTRLSPLRAQSVSPNETVNVAVMGLNGRGAVLARTFARTPNVRVAYVCDVDSVVLAKSITSTAEAQTQAPRGEADFRRTLDDKEVDALVIAAPDHWHAPAALLAMSAGKHVYLEKPCGHNAHEGELLVESQRRHRRVVQQGTQQRSDPRSIEAIQAIREGAIGRPYLARAWYANRRATIGRGKVAPSPSTLDYEMWQGPAPRTPYRDNVIHYNWHWFHRWGTGEICNNGTHEIDICRWALGVEYPVRVTSCGGRYHFDDDWEFPDTQEAGFDFPGEKTIVWHGQSCNAYPTHGRSRGASIHGTEGTVVLDRNGYTLYDLQNKVVRESLAPAQTDGLNISADDASTASHIANFVDGIRTGAVLRAPIDEGAKSVLLCHLGNIAQQTGQALQINPASGHIEGDRRAKKLWKREYARGWEPSV